MQYFLGVLMYNFIRKSKISAICTFKMLAEDAHHPIRKYH